MSGQANGTRELSSSEVDESSTLDHALLESLFYNEMMMLNGSSPTSNSFFSQHFSEATNPKQPYQLSQLPPHAGDPTTIAESEMLRDFGVSSAASHPSSTPTPLPVHHDHHQQHSTTTTSKIPTVAIHVTAPAQSWNNADPAANAHTHVQQQHVEYSTAGVAVPSGVTGGATYSPVYSTPTPLHSVPSNSVAAHLMTQSLPVDHQISTAAAPGALSSLSTTATMTSSTAPAVATTAPAKPSLTIDIPPAVPQERAKQLVSQFATLASRLGIELPTSVLQSLTTAAAQNDSSTEYPALSDTTSIGTELAQTLTTTSVSSDPSLTESQASNLPITIAEHRKTAAEAIASVKKRRSSDSKAIDSEINDTTNESISTGGSVMNNGKEAIKHSKRRKKPRLSDCASRLAELKAENELLKRHLQNVSNKAHRFDQEREEAGKRIHDLLEEKAASDQMDAAVNSFTDLYSDYGKNRQQELSFHLQQLQRLVNPTNFTKMGLWTMGQNNINMKRNPIAGILQNELEITAAQGRKILEQSEKIRALCENLKECLALLAKLKSLCEQKTQIFHDRMNKCREILTSKQVVKLIKWINDHSNLLESVCPGWGTEHIHSSVSKLK